MTVVYNDRRNPKYLIVGGVLSEDRRTSAQIAAALPRPPFPPTEEVVPHLSYLVKRGLAARDGESKASPLSARGFCRVRAALKKNVHAK
jgi:hypothetical protein